MHSEKIGAMAIATLVAGMNRGSRFMAWLLLLIRDEDSGSTMCDGPALRVWCPVRWLRLR
jgi:hypothetical protein